MVDPQKERDWEKEMAEVDRLLKKLPEADPTLGRSSSAPTLKKTPAVGPGHATGAAHAARPAAQALGTWIRVGLGVLVGIGMTQWPYAHACGPRLVFYLIGVGALFAAGVWSSVSSWKSRHGLAHILSQGLIIWALALTARELLPRIGYAKTAASWFCR